MPDISANTGLLGTRLAAHLLRRATFSPTKAMINDFAAKTPAQAVSQLLLFTAITNKPLEPASNATWVDTIPTPPELDDVTMRDYVSTWMIDNLRTDNTLRSKMIVFLHQNWMVDESANSSHNLYDYLKLLEYYSLGSYKSLATKMCRDNRMLVYLNGNQNTGNNPNENYAREFLELFTIGKGPQIAPGNYTNYTEDDIKEAAKVLSGYQYQLDNVNTDPDTGIRFCKATASRHSTSNKIFSICFGAAGVTITGTNTVAGMASELNQFVNMVFNMDETAKNICRKLYRYFVHRNISAAVELDIITPMATALKNDNYNISTALSLLLQSRHFYDLDDANATDNLIGGMIKSPLELVLQTMNFFSISPFDLPGATPTTIWNTFYRTGLHNNILPNCGMQIFGATTVAGFAAYYSSPRWDRNWFDSSTISQRYYLGRCFLENKRLPFSSSALGAKLDIVGWVRNHISSPSQGAAIVNELIDYLFPELVDADRKSYFLNQALFGTLSQSSWEFAWNNYLTNGALDVVKPRLEQLFKAIIYAQEYQLK
ncbi:MAG TPA: DUF1800 family protein [Ferruginibacter sp.]|nr:DUF1800 family protein [Ferruginibacter sp.]HRE63982.1 DUF1800 family protein [Ferruginibacter sp.]